MLHHHGHTIDLGSGTTYKRGKYSVSVGNDGSIFVRPGDWLTKYSAAIYGNFWTIDGFCRKDKSGNYIPITHPARIFAGETLYHMPTVKNAPHGNYDEDRCAGAVLTAAPISEIEKTKLAVDQFKAAHPELSEIAGYVALGGHTATDVVEAFEWFEIVPEVAGEVASPLGLVLFCIHTTLDIIDAYNTALRAIGLRAAAYGVTAWSFDDPVPLPPQWLGSSVTQQATQAAVAAGNREFGRWVQQAAVADQYGAAQRQKSWIEGCDKAMKELDEMVQRKKLRKEACQVAFQAIGKNDPNTLAVDQIMTEMASHFDYGERSMFWAPPPKYPSN
jgi:hypothetical protein